MNKPVILIVDDDPQVLAAVRRDLRSRTIGNIDMTSVCQVRPDAGLKYFLYKPLFLRWRL